MIWNQHAEKSMTKKTRGFATVHAKRIQLEGLGDPKDLQVSRLVDLRPIKNVAKKLPPTSVLREVVLAEPADRLDFREFLGKIPIWLKLLEREVS